MALDTLVDSDGNKVKPNEEGSVIISVGFTDQNSESKAPKTLNWKLTDHGTVVNGRSGEVVSSPSAPQNIVLSGDDLGGLGSLNVVRTLTVWGTYDSADQNDLTFSAAVQFEIIQLEGI